MPNRVALSPAISCENLEKTYDYFTQVLGFAGTGKMAGPDGNAMHASVVLLNKYGETHVMLGPKAMAMNDPSSGEFGKNLAKGPLGNGVVFYFSVPNVDKYAAFVKAKGAMIDEEPTDQFWGDRTLSVTTPDGYYLTFATPIKGFKWPAEMASAITDPRKATAPGAKTPKIAGLPTKKKAAAKKVKKVAAKKKR